MITENEPMRLACSVSPVLGGGLGGGEDTELGAGHLSSVSSCPSSVRQDGDDPAL